MSATAQLRRSALRASQPVGALLELTYACNWRCVFCYNPRHHDVRHLSTDEWRHVLDDLRALGTLTVTLTGGEPMARPDFFEIAAAARDRRMAIRVFTNGSLIGATEADRLCALFPFSIELSLHGATAETHDRATAKPGSFMAMQKAISLLKERDAPVRLKSPITSLNEHELDEMTILAERLGVPYQLDGHITPRDDGDTSPVSLTASPETIRKIARIAIETGSYAETKRTLGGMNCSLGRTTISIDPEGHVYPCHQWRHQAMGNVRTTRLRDLWASSEVRQNAAATAVEANDKLLALGGPISAGAFCPALAFQHTGDPLTIDDDFAVRASIVSEVQEEMSSRKRS